MKTFTLSKAGLLKLSIAAPVLAATVAGYQSVSTETNQEATDTQLQQDNQTNVVTNNQAKTVAASTVAPATQTRTITNFNAATPVAGQGTQGTFTLKQPETASINPDLPVVNTSRKSDYIKANMLNPFPVCNATEDVRTVVYKVSDNWLPVGNISTFNQTNTTIPLTQTTSKSQTISISINGTQSSSLTANAGGDAGASKDGASVGSNFGIAFSLARQIGGQASYSLSWNIGQAIGPYDVPAGYTGDATYGFRAVNMTGTRQFCLSNGTWSTPTAWRAFVPIKNEVRVKLYDNIADSVDKDTQPSSNYIAPLPQPATNVDMTQPTLRADYDLEPYLTVSSAKAVGYAGSTALHIKNVGNQDYYGDFPVVSFLVEVKTAKGPDGVDRVIKPHWYKGAYVQDLGFDREKSTRSFLVTLSNPVNVGDDVTVASFNFFDGYTRLGRINNYITISQVGRIDGDTSYYNDTLVDSRNTTKDDFGNLFGGLF